MYLVVIGWLYVAVLMAVAEATSSTGSVLGAIITFFLYGLLPVSIMVYLMGSPLRKKARLAAEHKEREAAAASAASATAGLTPDERGHAASGAVQAGVAPVRKEP